MKYLLVVLTMTSGGLNVDAKKEFDVEADCLVQKTWVEVTPLKAGEKSKVALCMVK